jgi:AraC family transcriptional regulator
MNSQLQNSPLRLNQITDITQQKGWLSNGKMTIEGCTFEHSIQPPDAIEIPPLENNALIFCLRGCQRQVARIGDLQYEGNTNKHGLFIVPQGAKSEFAWDSLDEALMFEIDLQSLRQVASKTESINPDTVKLQPIILEYDEQITRLAYCLLQELRTGGENSRLYSESLLTCFNIHLLRHYCIFKAKVKRYSCGISPHRLRQVQEYIQNYLGDNNLSLQKMSEVAELSKYHFIRQFRHSTGLSPHQYVKQQRIEKAKQLLKQEERSIIEIALECGFSNHSHFSKTFRKVTNITPRQFRNQ